jgi:hypothetical protein
MGLIAAAARSGSVSFAAALTLLGSAPRLARAAEPSDLPATVEDPAPAPAPEAAHALPPIHIHMQIARASESPGAVAPEARDIFEHLPSKYQSLALIEDKTVAVLLGEQARVSLPNGREVVLLPIAVHGGQLHMQLEMPDVVNTSMRLSDHRAFYVGGVRMDQGILVFKLVPEFSAYVGEPNQTNLADQPVAPTAQPASSKTPAR